jgi:hypothetical protein
MIHYDDCGRGDSGQMNSQRFYRQNKVMGHGRRPLGPDEKMKVETFRPTLHIIMLCSQGPALETEHVT